MRTINVSRCARRTPEGHAGGQTTTSEDVLLTIEEPQFLPGKVAPASGQFSLSGIGMDSEINDNR